MKYQTLDLEFKSEGWFYQQVIRDGNIALYKKSKKGNTRQIEALEVIVIQQLPERTYKGVVTPAHEAYPTNTQWGKYGWSYSMSDLKKATAKMESLIARNCVLMKGSRGASPKKKVKTAKK